MKVGESVVGFIFLVALGACGGGNEQATTPAPVTTEPPVNYIPVANAGAAQSVLNNTLVVLDGSASRDADNNSLTYVWILATRPPGSTAFLNDFTAVKPTFIADSAGTYVAQLVVNDGFVNSQPSSVTITASVINAAPIANAGVAQSTVAGNLVELDGSGSSDANGDALSYLWSLTSRPSGSTAALEQPNSPQPSLVTDVPGIYLVSLVVSDGRLESAESSVTVTASEANAAPVANAGAAQEVMVGDLVTLDGRSSSDANGDPLTYAWTMTAKPAGSNAVLASTHSSQPTLTPDVGGTYVATLVVNDGKVDSSSATVAVSATEVEESLTLLEPPGSIFGGGSDTVLPMPYTTTASQSGSTSCVGGGCPTTYDVATFRLRAAGRSFTVTDVQALNTTTGSALVPVFDGLVNNQVIDDGETVTFALQSPFTGGETIDLVFSFEVAETGDTFRYLVQLQTN